MLNIKKLHLNKELYYNKKRRKIRLQEIDLLCMKVMKMSMMICNFIKISTRNIEKCVIIVEKGRW